MAVRRESVRLELDDAGFSTGMARAASMTALLDRRLDELDGSTVRAHKSTTVVAKDVDRVGVVAKRTSPEIDRLSGRMRIFADAAAVLGPSLAPISAVAVPALTGLASQVGFAAIGLGTLVVAAQGVGDALKAVNEAALEPTAANLEKARQAMAQLGPDAQAFVARFQEIRPVLADIRDSAAAGWFPGLTESLTSLEQIAPEVASLFERIGRTGGDLVAEGAAAFAGPEWEGFRSFVAAEAPRILDDLGRTLGNVAKGMAELWQAFGPLNRSFSSWLLDASRSFADWADGLSETEGFQEFVDYIRTNGPRVAEALKAVGSAVIEIVEAVAPLGGPSLKIIEVFADAIAAIADSDLGTPILAGVAALALLNRTLQVTAALQSRLTGSTAISGAMASGGVFGALTTGARGANAGIRGTIADLKSMRQEYARVGSAQAVMLSGLSRTTGAAERTAARMKTLGKTSAVVGGLAVATTGVADGMGLSNTASLGLMGTLAGPWGAAVGAGAGLLMDLNASGQQVNDTFGHTSEVFRANGLAIRDYGTGLNAILQRQRDYIDQRSTLNLDGSMDVWSLDGIGSVQGWKDRLGVGETSLDKYRSDMKSARSEMDNLVLYFNSQIRNLWGEEGFMGEVRNKRWESDDNPFGYNVELLEQTDEVLRRLQPAMEHYGLTVQDLVNLQNGEMVNGAGWDTWNARLVAYADYLDSAKGRTDAVVDALAGLDDASLTTAQSADALARSLSALLDPNINLSAQRDAWTASLRSLDEELNENNKTLKGNSDAALENRAAVRDRVAQMQELLTAEAAGGASSEQLTRKMRNQRRALIEAGVAAGISRKEMREYVNQLGLTPELVRTLIEANASQAFTTLDRVKARLAELNGSTAWVHVKSTAGAVAGVVGASADGSTVPKDGGRYEDRYPYLLAPGEEVISNRNGQADRFRPLLKAINAGRLASGGTVGRGSRGGGVAVAHLMDQSALFSVSQLAQIAEAASKGLLAEMKVRQSLLEKEIEASKDRVSAIREEISSLKESVATRLKSNIFDRSGGTELERPDFSKMDAEEAAVAYAKWQSANEAWMRTQSGGSLADRLRNDIAGAQEFDRLIAQVAGLGLKGKAFQNLVAEGDLTSIRDLASSTRAEVAEYQRLYNLREKTVRESGSQVVALSGLSKQLGSALSVQREMARELRATKLEMQQMKRLAEKNKAKDVGREVGKAINGNVNAAAAGRR